MNREINQQISASVSDKIGDFLGREDMRKRVIEIFKEEVGKVEFAEIIKKYAAEEMDKRVFRSFSYWFTVILTAFVTGAISIIINNLLSRSS